jgi:hypothetical protein
MPSSVAVAAPPERLLHLRISRKKQRTGMIELSFGAGARCCCIIGGEKRLVIFVGDRHKI